MLVQISLRNLGLIENAEIDLSDGFQVITGETGVGKSMLLRSLAILSGSRARSDWIRTGTDEARVSGFFRLENESTRRIVEDLVGLDDLQEDGLLVERRLRSNGRHQTRINGREVPLSLLRSVASRLMEIHGQRSQLSLLNSIRQLEFLDRFAGLSEQRDQFRTEYRAARALADHIDVLCGRQRGRNDRRLFLEHVLAELDDAAIRVGEKDELEGELNFLEDRDRLTDAVGTAIERFYDSENSLIDQLNEQTGALAGDGALHPGIHEFLSGAESARLALEDSARALRGVSEDLESDPSRLEGLRQRFDLLSQLEGRHKRSADELVAYREELTAELASIAEDNQNLPALEDELHACLAGLGKRARSLGRKRRRVAEKLQVGVARELDDLGMAAAVFEVGVVPLAGRSPRTKNAKSGPLIEERMIDSDESCWHGFNDTGADRVDFLFGPNPGEPVRLLKDIASGGELSRVTLALEHVLADADGVPILVFDEIDAGVGGRLGTVLGQKLSEIAIAHQVVCVTHLPQVACYGTRHFHVTKAVVDGRTISSVEVLSGERREEELAAMIRGESRTELSRAEAREMLAEAKQ